MSFQENELIDGCVRCDRAWQRRLYERFSRRLFVVCLRYTKSRAEAEDVLQEAFIKIFEKIKEFRREAPLEAWLKRITVNTALNHNRTNLRMFPAVDTDEVADSVEDNVSLAEMGFQDLLGMVQQLPPRYQVVFNLYAIEGYKHHEIADMLGINEGTSKSQFARARAALREMIEEKQHFNSSKNGNNYERFGKE
ncbi:MAG: RNA polymerase sigma factor [Cytophagales bacterium]|nr:RNA polymerase sigma factor [Cytophagales bacterium]